MPEFTFAIGDIHGCLDKLARLAAICQRHSAGKSTRYVLLGDYIDRGPDSRGVIDFIRTKFAGSDLICLKGNHEELFENALAGRDQSGIWLANGGDAMLRSYGASHALEIPTAHRAWIASLKLSYDDGKRFFVHAGIDPRLPLAQQSTVTMLWTRRTPPDAHDCGRFVVHGHTPMATGLPDLRPNRVNLDTAAVFGGPLTAALFAEDRAGPILFLNDLGDVIEPV